MSIHTEPAPSDRLGKTLDRALAWFAHMQDDKANLGDRMEFAEWLAASPYHQTAYDKVVKLWQSLPP